MSIVQLSVKALQGLGYYDVSIPHRHFISNKYCKCHPMLHTGYDNSFWLIKTKKFNAYCIGMGCQCHLGAQEIEYMQEKNTHPSDQQYYPHFSANLGWICHCHWYLCSAYQWRQEIFYSFQICVKKSQLFHSAHEKYHSNMFCIRLQSVQPFQNG